MKMMRNFITKLHQSTKREYLNRMIDDKVDCMIESKKYDQKYWDGDRKYGYGGYKYIPDRWKPLAQDLIKTYSLSDNSKILDIGCGKGYLLYEIKKLLPDIEVIGIDSSGYAIENSHEVIKPFIIQHRAQDPLPFQEKDFDLVISITTLHNLRIFDLMKSVKEIERVGKNGYIVVESYRNEQELFNLECWALTCESFFDVDEWIWIYNSCNYTGDYEFILFE
jgi:SAM-dependent methyltransferase